jgi:hypothetical protein
MNIVSVPLQEYIDKYTADATKFDDREWLSVKHLCEFYGVIVAGGSMRRLVANQPISDGDIDLYETLRWSGTKHYLKGEGYAEGITPASWKFGNKMQLILGQYVHGASSIFKTYDFGVCCFATDFKTLWGTEQAFEDVETKKLRLNKLHKHYPKLPKKYRIRKYTQLGYSLDGELVEMIYNNLTEPSESLTIPEIVEDSDPYSDGAFDPHDLEPEDDL